LIGRNGSGKSALLCALLRLFGETRDERLVRAEDFFVAPGETLESAPKRQLFVEALIVFPELETKGKARKKGKKTVPPVFKHMIVEGHDQTPFVRIRIEATWEQSGTLDGAIDENIYWLLTPDLVPFGEPEDLAVKRRMTAAERGTIVVRYIPATRDVTALTRLTVRSLGQSLMQSVLWENKEKIQALIKDAAGSLDSEAALKRVNGAIDSCWKKLNAADTETSARLSVLPPDFQQIVRAASILLEPSPTGRVLRVEDLSDGQRSLFHFALVKSLLDLKLALEEELLAGKKPPFAQEFARAPALTVFAFEEPENHLAPYFLARLISELQALVTGHRVQSLITSHSPAIVGRLEPTALRHLQRNSKTGVSIASSLKLPEGDDEAAKFVREAVRAHPELYFARHVIFGEGSSEEIVVPRLADALGVPMDRSFVAIVPIGGRHIGHFWRLVGQLGIPHTTLLDLDLGRSTGDTSQFKAVAAAILAHQLVFDETAKRNLNSALGHGRANGWTDKGWTDELIGGQLEFFEGQGVFFSAPLDLDMLMLSAFAAAYQVLPEGKKGPKATEDEAAKRVLGEDGFGAAAQIREDTFPVVRLSVSWRSRETGGPSWRSCASYKRYAQKLLPAGAASSDRTSCDGTGRTNKMSTHVLLPPPKWVPVGISGLEDAAMEALQAVRNTLVTAGPGAGKTELLGQRGVYLLQTGACAYPERILAISFKRDAARNLRERFRRRCSREQVGRLDSITFDAFSKQLLDRFWRALPDPWSLKQYRVSGIPTRQEFNDWQLTAASDLSVPKRPSGWAATLLGKAPTSSQIHGVTYDAFNLGIHRLRLSPLSVPTVAAFLQLAFMRRAFERDPVPLTFPMIGILAELIIATNPKILDAILATYSHVFVDEFQDTTGVQYALLKGIFAHSEAVVTAVGDDKQKIMGWAGAQTNNFELFKQDFLDGGAEAGQRHITLSVNYRSNARIVAILNTLKKRLAPNEPDFRPARPAPNLPPKQVCSVLVSPDVDSEAVTLAKFISALMRDGLDPRSIGLLVRQKAADWEKRISGAFEAEGILVRNEDRDVGGATIQDLMTEPYSVAVTDCLELLLLKRGGAVWARVIEVLGTLEGIVEDEDPERMQEIATALDEFHAAHIVADENAVVTAEEISALMDQVEDFFGLARLKGLGARYQQGDFFDRIRNATRLFLKECAVNGASWKGALVRYRGDGQVPLMTITKSKGLEYDVVVLLGLDDNDWWSFQRNPDEGHSTFFVAASRARERLFMTLCEGQRTAKISEIYRLLQEAGVQTIKSDTVTSAGAGTHN
jgi:putative ATP-dependent endonuclease of OLD family